MAGYSGTPLVKKIGIKPDHRVAVVDSPNGFAKELGPMPEGAKFVSAYGAAKPGTLDVVILFLKSRASMEKQLPKLKTKITQAGMIWAAWPKKACGIETDLNENIIRDTAIALGLVDIKVRDKRNLVWIEARNPSEGSKLKGDSQGTALAVPKTSFKVRGFNP